MVPTGCSRQYTKPALAPLESYAPLEPTLDEYQKVFLRKTRPGTKVSKIIVDETDTESAIPFLGGIKRK